MPQMMYFTQKTHEEVLPSPDKVILISQKSYVQKYVKTATPWNSQNNEKFSKRFFGVSFGIIGSNIFNLEEILWYQVLNLPDSYR